MYKLWAIKDIRKVIDEIEKILEYPCDLKIEISNRATKRMGAFFYKKEKGLIVPIKFVFAKRLLDGNYPEHIVREVIIHEYLHYYCDTKTGVSNGHNKFFKSMCLKCGISDKATFIYKNISEDISIKKDTKVYNIHCRKCGKLVCVHKRKDAAERKIKGYVSKCCNFKLEYKVNKI